MPPARQLRPSKSDLHPAIACNDHGPGAPMPKGGGGGGHLFMSGVAVSRREGRQRPADQGQSVLGEPKFNQSTAALHKTLQGAKHFATEPKA